MVATDPEDNDNPKKSWTFTERFFVIAFSLAISLTFLYLGLRDNTVFREDLTEILVTLKGDPKTDIFKVKTTTYKHLVFRTNEYQREFRIIGMTYEATDLNKFFVEVKKGDELVFWVKTSDLEKLNDQSTLNNYNEIFDIVKSGKSYVNLDTRTKLKDEDSKWAFVGTIAGLIGIAYGFLVGRKK